MAFINTLFLLEKCENQVLGTLFLLGKWKNQVQGTLLATALYIPKLSVSLSACYPSFWLYLSNHYS